MRILPTLLIVLAASSAAQAQSLLGDAGASPNDPPPRPVFKKRDHLRIAFPEGNRACQDAWVRFDGARSKPAGDPARTIAAEVVDIRPNGVLVVQAIRRRVVNGDEERIRLSGEVSPEAVRGNAVDADKVVHLSVAYEGPGAAGGLGGILGKLWPF